MKHYIFLSMIMGSGGIQCHNAAKAKYLESIGWQVVIISDNNPLSKNKCLIQYLDKYLPNGNPYLSIHPSKLPCFLVERIIKQFVKRVGPCDEKEKIIVESCDDTTAVWGELLASRLNAKHLYWTANEYYRGESKFYLKDINFYMFKMDRGEIFTKTLVANRLFDGYRKYEKGDFLECSSTEEPIQDVSNPIIESLSKKDYSICYIGRTIKPYFPNIVEGVKEFALNHENKTIQLILVGEVETERKNLLTHSISNLQIIELGNLFPIPRILYSKIDVVIAGSGSARHSADEGALVITADPETCDSHGLLGYDTNDSVYKGDDDHGGGLDISFSEALERTLIDRSWMKQENEWVKSQGVDECTKKQFELIEKSDQELKYYDKEKLLSGKKDWSAIYNIEKARLKVFIKNLVS